MFYASLDGALRTAEPGLPNHACPSCAAPVRAKCGQVVTWHWAHLAAECDPWAERDTKWHLDWQLTVPRERREIVMGPHRADMLSARGDVVELQHSSISVDEIRERERFYGPRMVWIFDATEAYASHRMELRFKGRQLRDEEYPQFDRPALAGTDYTFRWKHPRKSLGACRCRVMLDFGEVGLLKLRRLHLDSPCGGWGQLVSRASVVAALAGAGVMSNEERK